ncbi:hypothetical protein M409DRAFT_59197 [Zasmidium cellare ATCC 36951]|uniref:Uncharacterized protein n=1 Tax=Zasmidium cellare ATCC 36951 TaxID=1080233 RepID=A0A6A6C6J2_ZASCE|nr:uncharacterized protein M409DRAFT_59197 [Zasmidium cellare ATCC 36951]KAF2161502.1 hypothetical protein M409DRAFT_59197 [Zasmidium cellare ATCC 36951]
MALDDLPLEIRERICSYVDVTYQPSVYSFALTSKQCLEAATASLFKTIRISVSEADHLGGLIERCYQLLKQRHAFKHVRRLEIVVMDNVKPGIRSLAVEGDTKIESTVQGWGFKPERYSTARALEVIATLASLTSLVAQLSGLTSFRHVCPAPLPHSIIEQLHRRQHCELEVDTVFPPYTGCCSSISADSSRDQIIADNASMMSSPYIRRVALLLAHQCAPSVVHSSSLRRTLSLLAPGTESISLVCPPEISSLGDPSPPSMSEVSSKRKVRDLGLIYSFYGKYDLPTLDQVLDFGCIEKLHIDMRSLERHQAWLTSARPFAALKSLCVHSGRPADDTVATFLECLPPLRCAFLP